MWAGVLTMPKPVHYLSRHTGWQNVPELRKDLEPKGYAPQATLGCIDAPTSMPGGAVRVAEFNSMRWAEERAVFRGGEA